MALAHLCSTSHVGSEFTGFIVDHGLRPESSDEAARVADELKRMNIQPRILKLDWRSHGDPKTLTNFETVARKLRYQALGRACYEERIASMLVGHHADDQAETLLVRILSGRKGFGLRGIKDEVRFPDCEGVYGVDGSGWTERSKSQHLTIEKGDLRILRPLLPYAKDDLIDVCRSNGVKWFEDSTNSDKSLTVRNTARHLLKSGVLPAALQAPRLVEMSLAMRKREEDVQVVVQRMFDRTSISLDLSIGQATFTLGPEFNEMLATSTDKRYHELVKACFLRRLLQLVSPQTAISLHSLNKAVSLVFGDHEKAGDRRREIQATQIAFVDIRREANTNLQSRTFSLRRQTPKHVEATSAVPFPFPQQAAPTTSTQWSDWLLWDNRYWIRVFSTQSSNLAINFLTPDRLGLARKGVDIEERKKLNQLLEHADGQAARWTIPAIISEQTGGEEQVVALPTLNWQSAKCTLDVMHTGKFAYEISYKEINFKETASHQIVSKH
jgi:tRNA(Ile)-lysidine synthetase-like protein